MSPDRRIEEHATNAVFDVSQHVEGAIGRGAVSALSNLPGERVVMVTDHHLAASTVVDAIRAVAAPDQVLVLDVGEPTTASVAGLCRQLAGEETLVAVGGGSVIDSVKLAAAVTGSSSQIRRHLLSAEPFGQAMSVVAVPTTAGAGAEVTRTCVVTDDGHKTWAWDELLRPALVVLDGALTVGLPPAATVATGLDAVVHAMEAATAQTRDDTAYGAALWALSELSATLPAVVDDPGDVVARCRVLAASTAAGLAIDRCATGVGHGLGHALGSLVPVPHGIAVSLAVWASAEFNQEAADPRAGDVAAAMGGSGYADEFIDLVEGVGLPALVAVAAERSPVDADSLAAETLAPFNAPMLANNVRPVSAADAAYLARRLADLWNRLGGHS